MPIITEINGLMLLYKNEESGGVIYGNTFYLISRFGKRWLMVFDALRNDTEIYALLYDSYACFENQRDSSTDLAREIKQKINTLTQGVDKLATDQTNYVKLTNNMDGTYCFSIAVESLLMQLQKHVIKLERGMKADLTDFILNKLEAAIKKHSEHGNLFLSLASCYSSASLDVFLNVKSKDNRLDYLNSNALKGEDIDVIINIGDNDVLKKNTVLKFLRENSVTLYYPDNIHHNPNFVEYIKSVPSNKRCSLSLPQQTT